MNRMEEYRALCAGLEQTPPALAFTVQRAQARRKKSRLRRALGVPAAGLAGLAAAFVLLVNLSVPFALACGNIPILKDLAAAVAFSPSLKAAVAHDYVQYIGQEQTQNGVTLRLDSLILDQAQISFFMSVAAQTEEEYVNLYTELTGPDGRAVDGLAVITHSPPVGVLTNAITANVVDDIALPETLRLRCKIYPWATNDYKSTPPMAEFTFEIPLNPQFTAQGETLPVDQWLTLDGQRVLVESLDVNPTHARLTLKDDPDNAMWLSSLECYLTDEDGVRYEMGSASGLSATGGFRTDGAVSYYFESPYFAAPEHLTLHITRAAWLEKDREHITLNLDTGLADWLPEDVALTVERKEEMAYITARVPEYEENHVYMLFGATYLDPEGGEHSRTNSGTSTGGERDPGYFTEYFWIPVYDWDTVTLFPCFSRTAKFDAPIALPIK